MREQKSKKCFSPKLGALQYAKQCLSAICRNEKRLFSRPLMKNAYTVIVLCNILKKTSFLNIGW